MNVVDRLSRGRRALIVWVVATVLLLGLFVVVRVGAGRGVDEHIGAAQDRAVGYAAVIGGAVELRPGTTDLVFNPRELATIVQAEIFDDPTVARVRLYGSDGVLSFATDQDVRPGEVLAPSEDPGVTSAASGSPYRSIVDAEFTWSTVGAAGSTEELLQTFEPLRGVDRFSPVGVVEVDFFMDDLRAAAIDEADGLLTVIAVLALLCLMAAVLTFRRTATAPAVQEAGDTPEDPQVEVTTLRTKLKTAEGRHATAERTLTQTREELAAATEASKDAAARVSSLEAELAAATAAVAAAGEAVKEPDPETVRELEELRGRLEAAESRAEEAGTRAEEAGTRAEAAGTRAEEAGTRAEAAESRAEEAEAAAAAARAEAESARKEAQDARTQAEQPHAVEALPEAVSAAQEDPTVASAEHLQRLEERIAAAERRAKEAEDRIERIAPLSEEANDLRARLARTAARKKLGPSGEDGD